MRHSLIISVLIMLTTAKVADNENIDFVYRWPYSLDKWNHCIYYNQTDNIGWHCGTKNKAIVGYDQPLLFKMQSPCQRNTGLLVRGLSAKNEFHEVDTKCLSELDAYQYQSKVHTCLNKLPGSGTILIGEGPKEYNDVFKDSYNYIKDLVELNSEGNDKTIKQRVDRFIEVAKNNPSTKSNKGYLASFSLAAIDGLFDYLFPQIHLPQWVLDCDKNKNPFYPFKNIDTKMLKQVDKRRDISPSNKEVYTPNKCQGRPGLLGKLADLLPDGKFFGKNIAVICDKEDPKGRKNTYSDFRKKAGF